MLVACPCTINQPLSCIIMALTEDLHDRSDVRDTVVIQMCDPGDDSASEVVVVLVVMATVARKTVRQTEREREREGVEPEYRRSIVCVCAGG